MSVSDALRMAALGLEYLNSPAAGELPVTALGEALTALGDLQDRLAAAQAAFLHRFDAANAHDADGYASSSAWLAAKGRMTKRDARAAVRQMRQFSERPGLHDAVAAGGISRSWADAVARWTRKLPGGMRAVHVPIRQLRRMPGAPELEDGWLRARLGEPADPGAAYLAGQDAEVAACDALTVPVVTGHADMTVIDKIIALAEGAGGGDMSAGARQAHRYAIARLAVDFVSGAGGLASALRTGLLGHPYGTPSLPLDIGFSDSVPGHIRRAVMLRDQHCAWPGGCDRPAAASDVHHIRHKSDGGETSLRNLGLFCEFHHETCIHRWGWQVTLHPDGTMEARSPDGRRVLRSHAPPNRRAA